MNTPDITEEQTERYLEAMGLDPSDVMDAAIDLDLLSRLVDAHQTHIPFQTITLNRSGETPSLDMDDIYQKVVIDGWGGYCFELNKLFEALLNSLGYDARPIYSRAVRGRDVRMPINHRAILVRLDDGKDAYVDVGFGGPTPSGALILEDGVEQVIGDDTFIPRSDGNGAWIIDRVTRGNKDLFDDGVDLRTQTEIELYEFEVEDIDFDLLNKALSLPGTLFRDSAIINLRTPSGHKAFKDGMLTIREDGQKQVIEIADEDLADSLEEHFGFVGILED